MQKDYWLLIKISDWRLLSKIIILLKEKKLNIIIEVLLIEDYYWRLLYYWRKRTWILLLKIIDWKLLIIARRVLKIIVIDIIAIDYYPQIRLLQGAAGAYQIKKDSEFEHWWESMLVLDDRESWRLSCAIEAYEPLNSSSSNSNNSTAKAAKKKANNLGHRKNDSLASTSSGSSSFLDTDSVTTAAQDSPAPPINRKMSTSSTTSSQPSLDASLHSTTSTTTTSPSTHPTQDSSDPIFPLHLHSNSLSNTSMTSQQSNTSGSHMSVNATTTPSKSNNTNPYITPEYYVIKVSLETIDSETEGVLYKSVCVNNSDRTAAVIKAAMEKHGIEENVDDYTLAQLLPNGEMILPSAANVYYAISTGHDLNFVLRRRRHGDENTVIRRHPHSKARKKLPVWFFFQLLYFQENFIWKTSILKTRTIKYMAKTWRWKYRY